jgi:hypothetical protein
VESRELRQPKRAKMNRQVCGASTLKIPFARGGEIWYF